MHTKEESSFISYFTVQIFSSDILIVSGYWCIRNALVENIIKVSDKRTSCSSDSTRFLKMLYEGTEKCLGC